MRFTSLHQGPKPLIIAGETASETVANLTDLAAMGVRRISMGSYVHSQLQDRLRQTLELVQSQQSFAAVFAHESH